MSISSKFTPQDVEAKWYDYWMEKDFFRSVPNEKEPYTIVIPPPNVTGKLHMGHMLNNTIQDVLIRRARMQGYNACWVPGTDHASIATEAKVVKMLAEKGIQKRDITREEFLQYAMEWKDKYGGIILKQLRKLGVSCDWERTRFTMEPKLSKAVVHVFVDLYKKGKIYRGKRMGHWDPQAQTSLSDQEVLYKEVTAKLYHVRYKIEGTEDEYVTIATTRPETILGDTAIAHNPNDERYAKNKGKRAIVPLVNRSIPIIFDDYVDIEFGSGGLKVTPAHDPNDFEIGNRHNLAFIDILNQDGTLSEKAQLYVGESREVARKKIVKELDEKGFLVKIEDITHNVGFSERTKVVVEPRLTEQWYMAMEETAKPALDAVMNDVIRFFPEKYKNTYRHWMANIRDWCISRQLWWGQQIPAFYLKDGSVFVAETKEEALAQAIEKTGNAALTLNDLTQDPDVVDTWFSSWLWPISVFDGFETPEEVDYYYPTTVLVTGWDIIFLWVARMVMAGYEWRGELPFKDVYFTGMVRDKQRRKMSKSLGNSPDPLDLIRDYGADGVRIGLLMSSPAGGDLLFDDKLVEQGAKFSNKIWNAMRLVKGWETKAGQNTENAPAIAWFENKLIETTAQVEELYKTYRLSEVVKTLYSFIWTDFCSSYLEMIKPDYVDGNSLPIDEYTYNRTVGFLEDLMKLLHPFCPFLTEEVYHLIKERSPEDCICVSDYPTYEAEVDTKAIARGDAAIDLLTQVRNVRNKNGLKQRQPLAVSVKTSKTDLFDAFKSILMKKGFLKSFDFVQEDVPNSTAFLVGNTQCFVELGIEIDVEAEKAKLQKDLDYQKGFKNKLMKKLGNERFVNNAPPVVIEKERKKLADAETKIAALETSLAQLG